MIRGSGRTRRALAVLAAVAVIVTATAAVVADGYAGIRPVPVVLDALVGVGYVVAGLIGRGPTRGRVLLALVGVTWCLGSLLAPLRSLHQAVLALFFLGLPRHLKIVLIDAVLAVGAGAIAIGVVPQIGVAALFVAISLRALLPVMALRDGTPAVGAYPVVAPAAVGLAVAYSWWAGIEFVEVDPFVPYASIQLGVAAGFVLAGHNHRRQLLRGSSWPVPGGSTGLVALQDLLRQAVQDDDLVVAVPADEGSGHLGVDGRTLPPTPDDGPGVVRHEGRELGRVMTTTNALHDPRTAAIVRNVVRLHLLNRRLQLEQNQQLVELTAVRAGLQSVVDDERRLLAARLLVEVVDPLAAWRDHAPDAVSPSQIGDLVAVARSQVDVALDELARLVSGVPTRPLGDGELTWALLRFASPGTVPVVRVTIHGQPAGPPEIENTLFYVCAEAVTNAIKHAAATVIEVEFGRVDRQLELTVADDGRGGADPSGPGLLGLADRLAGAGGSLSVQSQAGLGTVLRAAVPRGLAGA